ncbi:MAG: 30S ribosome-binding factor RbfA [Chlorobiaceae bacterium]|nr:30S ribosome-binding factor RbfA [Chlorobiaceae bacterium]MBA4310801.1 30S ribosome-binding factor RbfA [Chlorobiaceae bacterium]
MTHRIEKVARLIKEEISLIFLHKLQDPTFGFITVTGVKVSPDLKVARIYISIFQKEKRDSALEKVKETTSLIRSELAHRISLRFVPELNFYLDDTADYVEKIDGLIKKIHEDDNKKDNQLS